MTPDTDTFIENVKALFWCAVFIAGVTLALWLGTDE